MNPSDRVATVNSYARTNKLTVEELLEMYDIVKDEFKANEQRQDKTLAKTKKNLNNIAKYLKTQGL